jgi:hypothetical protein
VTDDENKEGSVLKTNVLGGVKTSARKRDAMLDEFERSGLSDTKFAAVVDRTKQESSSRGPRRCVQNRTTLQMRKTSSSFSGAVSLASKCSLRSLDGSRPRPKESIDGSVQGTILANDLLHANSRDQTPPLESMDHMLLGGVRMHRKVAHGDVEPPAHPFPVSQPVEDKTVVLLLQFKSSLGSFMSMEQRHPLHSRLNLSRSSFVYLAVLSRTCLGSIPAARSAATWLPN